MLWALTWNVQLKGYLDVTDLAVEINVYAKFPIFPGIFLGQLKGNLNDGVSISFSLPGIAGDVTLFARDGALWIRFSLTVLGETYSAEFELFPIPGKAEIE